MWRSTIPTEEFCKFAEALEGWEVEVDYTTTSSPLSVYFSLGNMRKIAIPSDSYDSYTYRYTDVPYIFVNCIYIIIYLYVIICAYMVQVFFMLYDY